MLVRCLEEPLALQGDDDHQATACMGAVIPPDVTHATDKGTLAAVLVYVDPDTVSGRRLRRVVETTSRAEGWRDSGDALRDLDIPQLPATWEAARALHDTALRQLAGEQTRCVPLHPALMRARAWLGAHLDDDVSLDSVAREVGMSGDRLSHLFGEQLGLGLRPFILYLRLQRAAHELARGESITSASAAAGFADGAHMTRTFRRMFGLVPSDVRHALARSFKPGATRRSHPWGMPITTSRRRTLALLVSFRRLPQPPVRHTSSDAPPMAGGSTAAPRSPCRMTSCSLPSALRDAAARFWRTRGRRHRRRDDRPSGRWQGGPGRHLPGELLRGIEDEHFEVRFACGRALLSMRAANPAILVPLEAVLAIVRREVQREQTVLAADLAAELHGAEDEIRPKDDRDRALRSPRTPQRSRGARRDRLRGHPLDAY